MALFLTGDIHGDADDLAARAEAVGARKGDEILVLGDVGLINGTRPNGVPRLASTELVDLMRVAPWRLVVMRGNHDSRYERDLLELGMGPELRFGEAHRADWRGGPAVVCEELPGAVFLADAGGLYDIESMKTLVAPGAYSVDKWIRLGRGWSWEPEEQLKKEELESLVALASRERPTVVLSHTCPLSWRAWMRDLLFPGVGLDADNSMECAFERLLAAAQPELRRWCFGHYHSDRNVEGGLGRLFFRDIAEFGSVVEGNPLGAARADYAERGDSE